MSMEHVEGSLKEPAPLLGAFLHRRHSTVDLLAMVDIRLSIVKARKLNALTLE
jgi:hypothetical protein